MKKAILIIGLMAITTISFAQAKIKAPTRIAELSGQIEDSVKMAFTLKIELTKPQAIIFLDALKAGYVAMPESDQISAKQYSHAKSTYEYLVKLIYGKWPDLIPK